jgi:IstB-like ATP binding protein
MNELKVHLQQAIVGLHQQGWSQRRIARELGLDCGTVGKYLQDSKPAISLTGSEGGLEPKPAIVHSGSAAGRPSLCEPWREQIELAAQAGLSAQRIYRTWSSSGTLPAVIIPCSASCWSCGLPFRRLEVEPGQEVQVDFGLLEVVMRRYENRSTIMTSNRPLEEWGKLLGDVPTAGAILDRFLHHAQTIAITGRSYRLKDHAAVAGKEDKNKKTKSKSNEASTAEPAS